MSTRAKFLIVAVGLVATFVGSVMYVLFAHKPASPVPEIAATPTQTATPTGGEGSVRTFNESIEEASARYPVLAHVPKITQFWEVEYLGGETKDGKIPLTVTIYVRPDESTDQQIEIQNRFIQVWLGEIGQQAGTYTLDINTKQPHTY